MGRGTDRTTGPARVAPGMRVTVRKERPHPGVQLRITDHKGMRITAFATNAPRGQLPVLELRHAAARAARTGSATPRTWA